MRKNYRNSTALYAVASSLESVALNTAVPSEVISVSRDQIGTWDSLLKGRF